MLNSHKPSRQIYQKFPHCASYFFEANEPPKSKNLMMDLSKLNIDTLDGSNWGTWSAQVQSATRILNCWDVIKGEVVVPVTTPPMYKSVDLTNGTDTNKCRPASGRTSIVEQEEQHCPWCNTRKNELGNLARVHQSRRCGHTMDCLGNKIWQSRGSHYLSSSSESIQSTYDGFISVASPNSSLPRKLHVDFSERLLKVIGGHRYIYILFFSSNVISRPRITISYIDRGHHQVRVAKNHCTGHRRRVSTQSAD